jgi:hypothetical protein
MRNYECTRCHRAKPPSGYTGWGLVGGLLGWLCGARGTCDDCLDGVTRLPSDATVFAALRQALDPPPATRWPSKDDQSCPL